MAPGPVAALILPIVLIGAGIGAAWAFVLQRVMSGAKGGEENIAAAAAATVQQAGIALGAAIAGLVANASGLDSGLGRGSVLRASLWVPLALVAAPLAACAIGVRLNLMVPRSPEQELTAARLTRSRRPRSGAGFRRRLPTFATIRSPGAPAAPSALSAGGVCGGRSADRDVGRADPVRL